MVKFSFGEELHKPDGAHFERELFNQFHEIIVKQQRQAREKNKLIFFSLSYKFKHIFTEHFERTSKRKSRDRTEKRNV